MGNVQSSASWARDTTLGWWRLRLLLRRLRLLLLLLLLLVLHDDGDARRVRLKRGRSVVVCNPKIVYIGVSSKEGKGED